MKYFTEFLSAFKDSYIQTFDDRKRSIDGHTMSFPIKDIKSKWDELKKKNIAGMGVYFTPNPCNGGRKESNVTSIDWIYCDIDDVPKSETLNTIEKCDCKPNIIVESFHGYHLYWKCHFNSREDFSSVVSGIQFHFCSDPAISSINEVLRLPGFYHVKSDPFLINIIKFDCEKSFTVEEMKKCFPKPEDVFGKRYDIGDDMEIIKSIPIKKILDDVGVQYDGKNRIIEHGEVTSGRINIQGNYVNRFSGKEGSGSTIDVLMHYKKIGTKDAIEYLKKMAGLDEKSMIKKTITNSKKRLDHDVIDNVNLNPYTWGTPILDRIITPIEKYHYIVLGGERGAGKCLGKGTKVLMYDGSIKNVEDIVVGDKLMGDDSTPGNVLSLARGREEMFLVKQLKAMDYIVNKSHILTLMNSGYYKCGHYRKEVIDIPLVDFLNQHKTFRTCFKGFKVGFNFPEVKEPLEIPPYLLGYWLGNGHKKSNRITVGNKDVEVVEYLKKYAKDIGLNILTCKEKGDCLTYSISTRGTNKNPRIDSIAHKLRELNVLSNKHIPQKYLLNSKENRLKLLAGLIDSDGYKTPGCNSYEIVQKRKELAFQIKFLCDSLGYHTAINSKIAKYGDYRCEVWRVYFSADLHDIPLLVERKKQSKFGPMNTRISGITIEPIGIGDYYGFVIDGNSRFLLEDGTVTHNTSFSFFVAIRNAQIGHKVMYLSLEMGTDSIFTRMARSFAGIDKEQWRDKKLITEVQKEAYKRKKDEMKSIDNLIAIGFPKGIPANTNNIKTLILLEAVPDIVFIDNFDLIIRDEKLSDNANEAKIAKFLMDFTTDYNIPIILLHHFRKKSGDKKVNTRDSDDFRGSGKILDNCDTALIGVREPYSNDMTTEEMARFTIVQKKDRDFGTCGIHTIYFYKGGFYDEFKSDLIEMGKTLVVGMTR